MEPLILAIAFIIGLVFRKFGYPPLLGYLVAGFVAHEFGIGDLPLIQAIADIGILLLLFTIGLKLNLRELAAPQIWGVASLHTIIAVVLTVPVILLAGWVFPVLALESISAAWTLAFALSFSSTVFAVKIFDERGENAALHAAVAIGILVIQDIFAVCYLVFTAEKAVSVSAVVLLGLPLVRPLLLMLLRMVGHGELLLLFGVVAALGAAELFELFNLKGGLGALIFGVLLGGIDKSKELYKALIGLKDLFLIGFFLQIGFYGLPSLAMLLVAFVLALLIFLRPLIYHFLLVAFNMRARTAFLSGIALFNYSEFGLIVGAIAVGNGLLSSEWLTTLALAMTISFFISTPFNVNVHELFAKYHKFLSRSERKQRLDLEPAADLGDAEIVVLGMGRVGNGAYKYLQELYGNKIIGVDESKTKVEKLNKQGVRCVFGDATDIEFWQRVGLDRMKLICVNLSNHTEDMEVVNVSKQMNFKNQLAVLSRFPDQKAELERHGCIAFDLYAEAGYGFAEHVANHAKI